MRRALRSLRFKLLAVILTIQAIMLGVIIYEQVEDTGERLQEQAELRAGQLKVLLNTSLAVPMAQLDYASAQEILDEAWATGGLSYLRLLDAQGHLVGHSGAASGEQEHDAHIPHDGGDGVYDARLAITLAGQTLGELHFGLPMAFLAEAQTHIFWDSLALAVAALVLSAFVLYGAASWLTRRLDRMAEAADRISAGEYGVQLPMAGEDEVGRVAQAFNRMAESLAQREHQLGESQQHLLFLAERDSLTGLYNRHFLRQELERRLVDAERLGMGGALLLFDLDDFKGINDTLGHQAGDALLIRVASEVERLVRRNEILCRLGGDEFVLILPGANEAQACALAERIVGAIGALRFEAHGHALRTACSLGVALYPRHSEDSEGLMAHADAAMYRAKQAGKGVWKLYEAELDGSQRLMANLAWKERIADALENGRMRLHFQGIYAMPERQLSHLEALVRMVDKTTGELIPPGQFIGIAEKLGLIVQLDRWVIRECVRRLKANPAMPPVAVNISGRSFDEPDLPEYIAAQLKEHDVDPLRLIIELTETAAVSDLADAERFIQSLRKIGCVVCLDDFGSGFASFAYLKHIQADAIKIDGSFIRDLPRDPKNQVFVRSMVEVARGLGVITIAECVEDATTLDMLVGYGVDQVQGYHLDRPQADHPALNTLPLPVA